MLLTRVDPEEPKPMDHIWRKLFCVQKMKTAPWWNSVATDQQILDAGYCLDRETTFTEMRS